MTSKKKRRSKIIPFPNASAHQAPESPEGLTSEEKDAIFRAGAKKPPPRSKRPTK